MHAATLTYDSWEPVDHGELMAACGLEGAGALPITADGEDITIECCELREARLIAISRHGSCIRITGPQYTASC